MGCVVTACGCASRRPPSVHPAPGSDGHQGPGAGAGGGGPAETGESFCCIGPACTSSHSQHLPAWRHRRSLTC